MSSYMEKKLTVSALSLDRIVTDIPGTTDATFGKSISIMNI